MKEERCDLLCVDAPRAEAIRGALLDSVSAREAAERARALSDPTRLVLAVALREGGELCVCDLAWISARAQNLVSHHLRWLRSHGLVTSRREGKLVMYSLTEEGRLLLGAVLEAAVAIGAGLAASSIALIGFGADSLIESLAGVILVWRFAASRAASDEAECREKARRAADEEKPVNRAAAVVVVAVWLALAALAVFLVAKATMQRHNLPPPPPKRGLHCATIWGASEEEDRNWAARGADRAAGPAPSTQGPGEPTS